MESRITGRIDLIFPLTDPHPPRRHRRPRTLPLRQTIPALRPSRPRLAHRLSPLPPSPRLHLQTRPIRPCCRHRLRPERKHLHVPTTMHLPARFRFFLILYLVLKFIAMVATLLPQPTFSHTPLPSPRRRSPNAPRRPCHRVRSQDRRRIRARPRTQIPPRGVVGQVLAPGDLANQCPTKAEWRARWGESEGVQDEVSCDWGNRGVEIDYSKA